MSKRPINHTLLEDLEAIQNSLDNISKSKPDIPTLEDIVGHRTPPTASLNPSNPFLSSQSLSDLINIRNEAENRAAQELKKIKPVRPTKNIAASSQTNDKVPDPNDVIEQMEHMFDSWIEGAISNYMSLFECELRNRLQQDFRTLIDQWYQDNNLPLPDSFKRPKDSAQKDD